VTPCITALTFVSPDAIFAPRFENASEGPVGDAPVQFLTSRQLADRWQQAEGTLRRWRHRRVGPTFSKIGGSVRYALADVEAFEKAGKRVPK
jgi:hypothetical protein